MSEKPSFRVDQPLEARIGWEAGLIRRGVLLTCALLLSGLLATAFASYKMKFLVDREARREFELVCGEIRTKILDRLGAHAQILRSGAAFYENTDGVDRAKWHQYTQRQEVSEQLPGIQGFGFSLLIPRAQLATHIQTIRAEGFPEYTVRPEGDREVYTAIIYLEPFTERNLRAFGYDMLSEPVRREAMERSRDLNSAILSGKVRLVQETEADVQAGTLMYVPVYRKGMPTTTMEERRAALMGWVYSPYRMGDLMRGILGEWDLPGGQRTRLEVFDGLQANEETLLYDSQSAEPNLLEAERGMTEQDGFDAAGRQWTLRFTRMGGKASAISYTRVWLVAIGGSAISLLMSGLLLSLFNVRDRARHLAAQLTAELRQSEQQLRSHFNSPIIGSAITSPDAHWMDTNSRLCAMLGYSREELLGGLTWTELTHPADLEASTLQFKRLLSGEMDNFSMDNRFVHKSGEIIWTHLGMGSVCSPDGTVKYVVTLLVDITERKAAEDALRESEFRWKFAVEGAGDGLWDWNVPERTVYFSKRWKQMLGYSEDEIGNSLDEWINRVHPDEIPQALADVQEHLAGMTPHFYTNEHRLRCKDGSWKWILDRGVVVSRDAAGQPLRLIGTHTDITKRKQTEDALQTSELRYRTLVESAPGIVYSFSSVHGGTYYSSRVTDILGYTQEQMHARPLLWYDSIHSDDLPQVQQCIHNAKTGRSFCFEYRILDALGNWHWLEDRSIECRSDRDEVIIDGFAVDITDRKWAEKKMADSLKEKEVLLREIHHRVKNNMQVIVSLLRMHSRQIDDARLEAVFDECRDRVNAMSLIHETLYQSDNMAEIDIRDYLKKLCRNLRQTYGASEMGMVVEMDSSYVMLGMDQSIAVGMVICELVSNAFKYAFPAGRQGTVSVSLFNAGNEDVKLIVQDDGMGLPETVDILNSPSLGLRLVVAAVTRELGGSIQAERTAGTRYTICFKCART